jgi:dTDP-D-glucose 4,6-dehydratase
MEIVKKIVKYMKNTDEIQPYIKYIDDRLFNDLRYSVSNSKLIALGWNETQEFESGLQSTIEWYLNCSETHWLEPK